MSDVLSQIKALRKRIGTNAQELKPVPLKWQEFAPLVKIKTSKGYREFAPFQYQKDFLALVERASLTVAAKTRQLGFSIAIVNWLIFKALSEPGTDSAVFSLNQQSTSQLARQARSQLESLNGAYCNITSDSLTSISFSNGSNLYFRNSSPDASRGLTLKNIIIDECSFVPNLEDLLGTVAPCQSIYGEEAKLILISTPNMNSGYYFDLLVQHNGDLDFLQLCDKVKDGIEKSQGWIASNGVGKFICHWRDNPTIKDKENYLQAIATKLNIEQQEIEREYNLSFSSSSEAVFSPQVVRDVCVGEMLRLKNPDRNRYSYYFGIDPIFSTGKNSDYFVATVLEYDHVKWALKLVDYYRKRGITSEQHQFNLGAYFVKYKPEVVSIETNSGGGVILERLTALYPSENFMIVKTTQQSKQAMLGRLSNALESKKLMLAEDKNLITELLAFREENGKLSGGKTHDDIVMSLSIALAHSPYATNEMPMTFAVSEGRF